MLKIWLFHDFQEAYFYEIRDVSKPAFFAYIGSRDVSKVKVVLLETRHKC